MHRVWIAAAVTLAACATAQPAPMHVRVPDNGVASEDGDGDAITVSWIGHATALIGVRGHWFLTDPVFSERIAGMVSRQVEPPISPSELPPLDAILISHAHFDHLDMPSLRRLGSTALFVPPGMPALLPADLPQQPVVALDTWQSWHRGDVRITAVPASHNDDRYVVDFWRTRMHTGWIIEVGNRTVYFAGDTGYVAEQARELGRRFRIDVGLIPVGPAGRPRWVERLYAKDHVRPDTAMELFRDTGAQWMVPIHFGTFYVAPGRERPLIEAAIARHEMQRRVHVLAIGETATFRY